MGFLYGNTVNHLPLTQFDIFETFPNRKEMQIKVEVPNEEEGREENNIDYGKYLLVDYSLNNNYSENVRIDKEYYGIDYDDTTINEGIFDLTVWQVQEQPVYRDDRYFNAPKAIAIARLHSILPTFESIGKYDIDILEPISDADFFGRGKNIWALNDNDNLPARRKIYQIPVYVPIDTILSSIKNEYPNATVPCLNIEDVDYYELHVYNIDMTDEEEIAELDALIEQIIQELNTESSLT